MMRHEEPDDLDWLAFCYIADELSLDEAAAFENRLADDQAAREAVARAVELAGAVAVVGAEDLDRATPASVVRGAWRRRSLAGRVGWTAITAAACLVVLVLAYRHDRGIGPVASSPQEAPGGGHVGISDGVPDELAIVWSQTREELAALQFDVWAADSLDDRDESEDWSPLPAEDDAEEDLYAANTPPSWMLAAVHGSRPGRGGPQRLEPRGELDDAPMAQFVVRVGNVHLNGGWGIRQSAAYREVAGKSWRR